MYFFLLILLITMVTVGNGDVIQTEDIDLHCKDKPCSTLNFYDENDSLIETVQGSQAKLKVKGVAKMKTVGHHGCYTIFKKTEFRSSSLCWIHMDKLDREEAGYEYSVVRSVRYDPNCRCPSKAGIPPWAIAIVILVVLMVALVIFVIYRKKRSSHEAVSSNDGV